MEDLGLGESIDFCDGREEWLEACYEILWNQNLNGLKAKKEREVVEDAFVKKKSCIGTTVSFDFF